MVHVIYLLVIFYFIHFAYDKGKQAATAKFLKAINKAEYYNDAKPETINKFVKMLLKYL